ncbi:MAG: thiamine ABC transporter substrate-binding protein [Sphaerochaetaceae bacterium]|nr:thiamine ABC transporter substrate-binding protein [Sphaerochaetaceae bacterium]
MKKLIIIMSLLVFIVVSVCAQPAAEKSNSNEITVYAYDSFTSDWGPGADLVAAFEEETGAKVNLIGYDGAVEMLAQVNFEGENCEADVVLGISDDMECDKDIFYKWEPKCSATLKGYREDNPLIPFDYGFFAFIFNSRANMVRPQSLKDLTSEAYKDQVILIDPRTSSVGRGLLMWTISVFGEEEAMTWWSEVSDNALTIASSWSNAYGLFTEGEAPLVLSYTTSPIYHVMYEDNRDFVALEFSEGHYMTTEYMGILKTSDNKDLAKQFCEFILTEGQSRIATDNTMFPANTETELPEAFDYALMPSLIVNENVETDVSALDTYIDLWTKAVVR